VVAVPEWWPSGHRAGVVLAHDQGADLESDLLVGLQQRLVARGFLSIRFNFPFAEQKRKRTDAEALLERTFRAAAGFLVRDPQDAPSRLMFVGLGLGARVAAQVVASGAKADVLVCLAFPLHPSGKPSQQRAEALFRLTCPILFVQGTRDAYCRLDRLEPLLRRIGAPTQLRTVVDADHELKAVRRTPRAPEDVREEVLSSVETFLARRAES
jgi:predicted alpha/beta-hydrolase family hydrolase